MQQERPGAPLPFEACENFRELGGYTGCGGRHVKYGAFYRSPALANIKTPADRARFEALGVRTVFDFRSEKERTLAPDPDFPGVVNIPASAMLAEDGSEVDFDLEKLLRSEDGIRMLTEGVHESYARMPFGNPAYRALFGAIRAGQTPILFHCTAGKDRTGVAAALILKALGVSREDIVEDYLLTNACRTTGRDQFRGMLERAGLPAAQAQQVTPQAYGGRALKVRWTPLKKNIRLLKNICGPSLKSARQSLRTSARVTLYEAAHHPTVKEKKLCLPHTMRPPRAILQKPCSCPETRCAQNSLPRPFWKARGLLPRCAACWATPARIRVCRYP